MSEQSVASARAAVLTYDSNLKKWMPSGKSAGLSKVHIFHHAENNTFRVVGRKLQDHEVVLNCSVLKGFKYFQATPLFHQWRDKTSQVYGLNFHSKEDAETFALAMERVIDILGHSSMYLSNRSSQSQPLYQTIGHSGVSLDDYAEYRGWMNNENSDKKSNSSEYSSGSEYGHYRSSQGNHSSHPTTPGSIPSPSSYSNFRTLSAPSMSQPPLSVASQQPSPQSSVPPPPPPPPPTSCSISGLATLPRLHLRPNFEQEETENSFAAALASAKLKKTPKASEVLSSDKPATPKGMACIIDEMTRTLARRRAQTDSNLDAESGNDNLRNWRNSTNACSPVKNSGGDSPQSHHRSPLESDGHGQVVVEICELEKMKQEILAEMRTEVNKMKQDIIDAIRMELIRR